MKRKSTLKPTRDLLWLVFTLASVSGGLVICALSILFFYDFFYSDWSMTLAHAIRAGLLSGLSIFLTLYFVSEVICTMAYESEKLLDTANRRRLLALGITIATSCLLFGYYVNGLADGLGRH